MQLSRLTYTLLITATIILGLLSRRFTFVPMFIGDILWATLVYFLFRFVLINASIMKIVVCSLLFSFAIEFGQLYTAPWMVSLRHTLFGRLVLGSTFYWWDLLCYAAGVFIGAGIEWCIVRKNKMSRSAYSPTKQRQQPNCK